MRCPPRNAAVEEAQKAVNVVARALMIGAVLCVLSQVAFAHLCNNIYNTPDRIIVKPERDSLTLETGDEVRVFVRNNYPTRISDFALGATTDDQAVRATVEPTGVQEMVPGEKHAFTVKIAAGAGATQGAHKVTLSIRAKEVGDWTVVHQSTETELIDAFNRGNVSSHVLAAESLARMKSQAGIDKLKSLLDGEGGRDYTARAIESVGRTGNTDLSPLLHPFLQQRDGFLKGLAALALGMLKTDLELLQPLLQDADPFVCCATATGVIMADKAPPGLVDELATRFLQHEDARVRVAAAWGCAWAGNENALKVIDKTFRDAHSAGDSELAVFAGCALLCLADQQEKKDAGDAPRQPAGDEKAQADAGYGGPQALADLSADRIWVKAEAPLPSAEQGGVLRVALYHKYPASLHNVRLTVSGGGMSGESAVIPAIRPTEIASCEVALKAGIATVVDPQTPLSVTVICDELEKPAVVAMTIPTKETDRQLVEAGLGQAVGEIAVRVRRFGDYYAFAWGVPLVLVVAASTWLTVRRRRHVTFGVRPR